MPKNSSKKPGLFRRLCGQVNLNTLLIVYLIYKTKIFEQQWNDFIVAYYSNLVLADQRLMGYILDLANFLKPVVDIFKGTGA